MSVLQPFVAPKEYELGSEIAALCDMLRGVTVAIPCYEQAEFLPRALKSVRRQTVPPTRVIVVDDGSPNQGELIRDLCVDVGAEYVRVTNRGLASARNTALMNTDTFGFIPLDADDWLDEQYIEKTLPLLDHADVVLTGIQEHGPTRNGIYQPGFDRPFYEVTADLILSSYNRFFYCSLFRTSLLWSVGGYNPKMSLGLEDADLWVDLLRRGVVLDAVQEPLFNYRTNPDGMLSTIHRDGGYEKMVAEMRRHHA